LLGQGAGAGTGSRPQVRAGGPGSGHAGQKTLTADGHRARVFPRQPLTRRRELMNRHAHRTLALPALAVGLLLTLGVGPAPAGEPATLKLVQTIPLKGAPGRLDHLAIDSKLARLFVANLSNNSLDIVDLKA